MHALIIDNTQSRLDHSLITLMEAGVQVTGTGSLVVAETCILRMGVDLLVIEKSTIGDALGDILGLAEERNPLLVSVLRTADVGPDQEELTPHFPSLHCVVGQDVPNEIAVKLGVASLRAQATQSVTPARGLRFRRKLQVEPKLPAVIPPLPMVGPMAATA